MAGPAPGMVWRDYDQAGLDRQYNSRGTVPDVSIYIDDYGARTRAAKQTGRCIEDLAYGPGADERLDIYPSAQDNAPVLVFLHGGDWRALSKNNSGFAAPACRAAGVTLVVPDFTLVPHTTVPQMGAQLSRAIDWVHQHIASYHGNPNRIVLAGHSSGANLVSQLLCFDWVGPLQATGASITGAAMLSGLGELEPVRLSFRNQMLQLDVAMASQASLMRNTPTVHCPLLVGAGANETAEYRRQAHAIADYWRSHGRVARHLEVPGRHHFDCVLDWADPRSALFVATLTMLSNRPAVQD